MRHPLLIDAQQPLDALNQLEAVERRQAGRHRRHVHALHVHLRTEDANAAVDAAVRLHSLEQLQSKSDSKPTNSFCVVKGGGRVAHLLQPRSVILSKRGGVGCSRRGGYAAFASRPVCCGRRFSACGR